MSQPFVQVPLSALSPDQRSVLRCAPSDWVRLPSRDRRLAESLERLGLVEIRSDWRWSRDPGAGHYVTEWRRVPQTKGVER